MKKFYFLLSLLMLLTISTGNVWAGQVTISPTQALNDGGVDPITVACAKGDGTSNPAISSSQLRLYQAASGKTTGNTITFSSSKSITSIVFTFANNMTASNGSFSEGSYDSETSTWTGSTTSLTLTVTGTTSGTRIYITNMVVTYEDGGDEPGGDEPGGGDDPAPTSSNWAKVDPADLATNDVVVIVENNSKAMSNGQGTSAAPTAVAVTVADDKLSADPADNIKWTVTVSNGSFVFATGDNHLYCTNTNNGVRVGTNANSAFTISTEGYLYNTATSRYVGVYNNTDWRCYTSINSNIQNQTFSFFKESDGSTPKQAAGLAYAEADQKKLAKLGNAFTAPTLSNPNNLEGITYASNNTDVATVADNGAVTIKAAGVATITASFDGNDNYKAGSASYTICVVTHAGTSADPYDVADARNVIDAFGTKEGVYMSGKVSQITTAYDETHHNISFDISTDGTTAADQVRAYRCKGLNNTDFTSADDVKTSATVTVYGNLTKYNSTYEFEAGCYLTAYEAPAVPKTPIANTQETAYTVAQALAYAADGETYDLDDYVYIQGVVYDVKSFNNGAMNIYIKDANADNKFEFFKCAGIKDGSSITAFEALSDVQVGNIVIGYGQMMYFKDGDIYEFKQGNYLVDLQVPVTGVELAATAEVAIGSTVTLTATILPSNATGTIVWSVTSGSDKASVAGGVVSGVAEGEAVIRATVQGTEIYAECTVTVSTSTTPAGAENVVILAQYDSKYYALSTTLNNKAFEAIEVEYDGTQVTVKSEAEKTAIQWTKATSNDGTTFQDANSKYLAHKGTGTDLQLADDAENWTLHNDGYYYAVENRTFLYYKDGIFKNYASTNIGKSNSGYSDKAQVIAIAAENIVISSKVSAELAYSPASVELMVGDEFTPATLTYAQGFDGLAAVTYESSNTNLATVEGGVVSLVADATGTATITATFAGNNNYHAGSASYTITVNEVGDNLSGTWAMVTDAAQLAAGKKVIITGITVGASVDVKTMGKQNNSNRAAVNGAIADMNGITILTPNTGTNAFTLVDAGDGKFAFRASNSKYLCAASSSSNHLKEQDENTADGQWTISIDNNAFATITAQGNYTRNTMRYNPNNGSPIFACYASTSTTGSLVTLFVLQEDEPEQPVDPEQPELNYEEVRTGLEVGRHYTICMPKKIIAVRGATFWGINNGDETAVYMELQQPPFEAGTPFIFYATASTLEVVYEGDETTETVSNGALRGTLSYMDHAALTAAGSQVYLMYNNALHPLGTNNHLDANRAYLLFEELQAGAPAPGRQVKRMPLQTDVTTGVEDAETSTQPKKMLIDGQLFIRCGEKLYNATGSMVK